MSKHPWLKICATWGSEADMGWTDRHLCSPASNTLTMPLYADALGRYHVATIEQTTTPSTSVCISPIEDLTKACLGPSLCEESQNPSSVGRNRPFVLSLLSSATRLRCSAVPSHSISPSILLLENDITLPCLPGGLSRCHPSLTVGSLSPSVSRFP